MSRDKQRPGDGRREKPLAGREPPPDAPPARAAAYIPPMAVPKESRYHTIDMKAVRLSPDIDPQRMKTQLSLRAVQAAKPPSGRVTRWLALLLVGGAIGTCAWWFSRWRLAREPHTAALGGPEMVTGGAPDAPTTHDPTPTVGGPLPTGAFQTQTGEAAFAGSGASVTAVPGAAAPGAAVPSAAVPSAVQPDTSPPDTLVQHTPPPGTAATKATAPLKTSPKRPLPRKVNAPAASGEPPKPETETPKLWLE